MNKSQSTHAKSIAHKIKTSAEGIVSHMAAIEREAIEDMTPESIKVIFHDLSGYWRNIQSVLKDMLGELDGQRSIATPPMIEQPPPKLVDTIVAVNPTGHSIVGKAVYYHVCYPTYYCNQCIDIAPLPENVRITDLTLAAASQIGATCVRCYRDINLTQKEIDQLEARAVPCACYICRKNS